MALWFECKAKYEKMQENGTIAKVNEPYLVDALTFTEAENRFIEELKPYISGEFTVSAVKKTKIAEIFYNDSGDRYFLVKVNFITIDEKSGIEKRTSNFILVQAFSFKEAYDNFEMGMKDTMADYEIASISETMLMDVFPLRISGKAHAENNS